MVCPDTWIPYYGSGWLYCSALQQWRIQKILVGGGFEAQNLKNSDVFTKIETDFSAELGNSNVFFTQIQVVSKKKKKKDLHQN